MRKSTLVLPWPAFLLFPFILLIVWGFQHGVKSGYEETVIAYEGSCTPLRIVEEESKASMKPVALEVTYPGGTTKLYDARAIYAFTKDPKATLPITVNKKGKASLKDS